MELRRTIPIVLWLALVAAPVQSPCVGDDGDPGRMRRRRAIQGGDDEERPKPPRTKSPTILLTSVLDRRAAARSQGFVHRYGIKQVDVERIQAALPNVGRVVPLREVPREARYADRSCSVRVIGTTANAPAVIALSFARGGFFGKRELHTRNNVAVIGSGVAESLFPDRDPVGRNMLIGSNYFLIVGRLKPTRAGRNEADYDAAVFIPLTTMRSRVNLDNLDISRTQGAFSARQVELTQVLVDVRAKLSIRDTAASIREYFQRFHKNTRDVELEITAGGIRR